jgi:hypothetical protein
VELKATKIRKVMKVMLNKAKVKSTLHHISLQYSSKSVRWVGREGEVDIIRELLKDRMPKDGMMKNLEEMLEQLKYGMMEQFKDGKMVQLQVKMMEQPYDGMMVQYEVISLAFRALVSLVRYTVVLSST